MVYDESLIEGDASGVGGTGGADNTGGDGTTGGVGPSGGATSGGGSGGGTGGETPTGGAGGATGGSGGENTGGEPSGGAGGTGGMTGGTGGASTDTFVDRLEHTSESYLNNPFKGKWGTWADTNGTLTSPSGSPYTFDDGGNMVLWVKGSGFAANNGMDAYITLNQAAQVSSVDVTAYTGVAFMAKASSATKTIRLAVEDETSHVGGGHPGMPVELTSAWKRHEVPFADIEFFDRAIVLDKAYAIHFSMDPLGASDGAVDFMIDDVAFYKK